MTSTWDSMTDFEREQLRRDCAQDARQDAIEAGECVCRDGLGADDWEAGPGYWAESDCPVHGDDVVEDD